MTGRGVIRGAIFDLDGVLVRTDELHFVAWKAIADREGIPFDRASNERFKGVSRARCLEMLLDRARRTYGEDERARLAADKDALFRRSLDRLGPRDILPGASRLLAGLRSLGIRIAVGSASRNARLILDKLGLSPAIDALVDGGMVSASKPDPEVFLLAATMLGVPARDCCIVEDSWAGAEAGRRAGMRVVGVGDGELGAVAARGRSIADIDVAVITGTAPEPRAPGDEPRA